jgi:hypothetical protein
MSGTIFHFSFWQFVFIIIINTPLSSIDIFICLTLTTIHGTTWNSDIRLSGTQDVIIRTVLFLAVYIYIYIYIYIYVLSLAVL